MQAQSIARSSNGLALFFLVTFAISWFWRGVIIALGLPFDGIGIMLEGWAIAGPCVAAVLITARRSGRQGVKQLLGTALRWRFAPIWYAVAGGSVLVVYLTAIGIAVLAGNPLEEPLFAWPRQGLLLLVVQQLWVAIGEEYGWRGFALPRLQERWGSLGGSLILGVIWAAWHLPLFLMPGSGQDGVNFGVYALTIMGHTLLLTLLYNRTNGSVLSAMLFHIALNMLFFTMNFPHGAEAVMPWLWLVVMLIVIPALPHPLIRRTAEPVMVRQLEA